MPCFQRTKTADLAMSGEMLASGYGARSWRISKRQNNIRERLDQLRFNETSTGDTSSSLIVQIPVCSRYARAYPPGFIAVAPAAALEGRLRSLLQVDEYKKINGKTQADRYQCS